MPDYRPIELRRIDFKEIYSEPTPADVNLQSQRCLDCGNPYCEWKCPLHNYIPKWLELVANGQLFEASELCHQTNPLPEMCGRICPQDRLCEGACTLNEGFGAVTIGNVEKYIVDNALEQGWRPDLSKVVPRAETVAIVGAGPAGLACADELIRQGIKPVVYDRYSQIGGLLTFGIPPFKLDKAIIQRRREVLEDMGVTFKLGVEIGIDLKFEKLVTENDAVFIGLGTYKPITGNFATATENTLLALPYLIDNIKAVMNESKPSLSMYGKKVAVLGGGDTAMDCVRTAIRQGASEVTCVYRRDKDNMPGSATEVKNAMEEGVKFAFCSNPKAILSADGKTTGLRLAKTKISNSAKVGRKVFSEVANSEYDFDCDTVIIAFGFNPTDTSWLAANNIDTNDWGGIDTNFEYQLQTSNKKVFAGGDMVRGSDLVVTAIADGKQAASAIIDYLDEDD